MWFLNPLPYSKEKQTINEGHCIPVTNLDHEPLLTLFIKTTTLQIEHVRHELRQT